MHKSSPSFFKVEHVWPRAGAATPPRPRPPTNFCWAAEPPRTTPRGYAGGSGGGVAIAEKSLFSDLASPSRAPRARASQGGVGRNRTDGDLAAAVSGSGRPDAEEDEGGGDGDGDDGWKARWSRRFCRGPIHSEYQDRFPWPPRSALASKETKGGGALVDGGAPPTRGRQASAFASATGTAGKVGAVRGGGGAVVPPAPAAARSASPLPLRQRRNGSSGGGRGGSGGAEEGTGSTTGGRGESEPPRGRRRAEVVSRAEAKRGGVHPSSPSVVGATGRYRGGELTGKMSKEEAAAARQVFGGGGGGGGGSAASAGEVSLEGGEQEEAEGSAQVGAPWTGRAEPVSPPPSDMRMSEWGIVGHNHVCGGSDNRGTSGCDEREWIAGRGSEHGGGSGDRPSRTVAVVGGSSSVRGAAGLVEPVRDSPVAERVEAWREPALGRGEVTTMSGGRTLDYSCQVCKVENVLFGECWYYSYTSGVLLRWHAVLVGLYIYMIRVFRIFYTLLLRLCWRGRELASPRLRGCIFCSTV